MSSTTNLSFLDDQIDTIADPITKDGSQVAFDKVVPLQLRKADDPTATSSQEMIRFRVLILGDPTSPEAVTVELTSENDVFFYLISRVDSESFQRIKDQQRITVDFAAFPKVITELVNSSIKEPESVLGVLFVINDFAGNDSENYGARLEFIQNIGYKYIEVLTLCFNIGSDELVKAQVQYRFTASRRRAAALDSQLTALRNTIRVKLPALYQQLQREGREREKREDTVE